MAKESKSKKSGGGLPYKVAESQVKASFAPRLRTKYREEVIPALMKEFGYENPMQVPKITKIVINMGIGEGVQNPNLVKSGDAELTMIAGQKAIVTKAKKSISNFKLREGMPIGCAVTLRRERMWEFLDRLFSIAMPRVRDFKGTSPKAFDGRGNYNLGLKDHTIFPEISYDKVDKVKGMNISIATTASNDQEGRELLKQLGMPFRK